jgi:hypothetical protein
LVQGHVASLTSHQGPLILVADWSVPHGQLRIAFPAENWMVTMAGGLTVTVVVPGAEAQAPVVAVTL